MSRRNTCDRKRTYTKEEAENVRVQTLRRRGIVVWPYRCEHCGWWHVGKRKWNMVQR